MNEQTTREVAGFGLNKLFATTVTLITTSSKTGKRVANI